MTPVAEAPAQTPVRPYSLAFLGFVWVPGGREPGYLAPPAHVIYNSYTTGDMRQRTESYFQSEAILCGFN